MIAEPMTTITDLGLAALALYLAARLREVNRTREQTSVSLWSASLVAMGVAAAAGGAAHGLQPVLGEWALAALWKVAVYAVGATSFLFLAATFRATLPAPWRQGATIFAVGQLAAYVAWMWRNDDFLYVIANYLPAMLVVLALQGFQSWRYRRPSATWIVAGVLASFLGAAVQQSGIAVHRQLNHNDLYHLVQMVAAWCFYRGGLTMRDHPDAASTEGV